MKRSSQTSTLLKQQGSCKAVIHCNLQVIVGHINGDYEVKGERLKEYLNMVKRKIREGLLTKFV